MSTNEDYLYQAAKKVVESQNANPESHKFVVQELENLLNQIYAQIRQMLKEGGLDGSNQAQQYYNAGIFDASKAISQTANEIRNGGNNAANRLVKYLQ